MQLKTNKMNTCTFFCFIGQSSIQVQAVCDNKMRFVDVFAGYPGSVHDARVFKESPLFEMLERKGIVKEGHLLGDAAYPLKTYLLTPYRDNGHLNPSQKRFNFVHSSCRCVIERAFALLKGKFRNLKYLDMNLITSIPDFVLTTCVLHNLILVHESQDQECEYQPLVELVEETVPDNAARLAGSKRDHIASQM